VIEPPSPTNHWPEPAPVDVRPAAAVFATPELERLYRAEHLQSDSQQALRVMLAVSIALLGFAAADLAVLGPGPDFWLLLLIRCLFLGLSLATARAVRQCRDPLRLEGIVLYWLAIFVAVDLFVVSTRPPDALGHAMIHGTLVLLIYVAVPLPLRAQVAAGLGFSLGYLYVVHLAQVALRPSAQAALVLALGIANLLGYFTSRRQQLAYRRLFAVLAHLGQMRAEADRRSVTDALTGLLNRRGWNDRLDALDDQCRASGRTASIVAIDLDGLKRINDTLGHAQGDALIAAAARCVRAAARAGDSVARVGGDELAVLAVDCDATDIALLVERIARNLAAEGIGASLGHATSDPERGLARAWEAADSAMYADKQARRVRR
jgi:diguanylate cyclase (GGDEF)-like protein